LSWNGSISMKEFPPGELEQIYLHERNSPWVSWNRSISMKEFPLGELEQIYEYLHEGIPPLGVLERYRDILYTNILYTLQSLYVRKFIQTLFIRNKIYTGQSLYSNKIYT